jgi:Mannosylglycerate hydrolase MGH1-like glycoside hydrolase domain
MEEPTGEDRGAIEAEAQRVLTLNEVDISGDYYHMPNWRHYPSLFAWDSAYHAVTMLHLNPEKARRELETLFRQVAPDGHMPHEVLVPCAATRAHPLRNLMRPVVQWHYDSRGASHLVDPPVYVYAALLTFRKTGDREWLLRIWEDLCRCLDYLLEERDLFGDGLVSILHPWEAGTDLSPQLLPALGIHPSRRSDVLQSNFYAALLYRFCNRYGWDPQALKAENRFVVEDLTMNCITIRALDSAAELAVHADDELAAMRYRSRAALMADAIDDICWDEGHGCYYPRWNTQAPLTARVRTAASLLPLFTGRCRAERAERLIEEHLLDPAEFWTEYLLPFNPHDELTGSRPWVERKLWCGHCIWINFNWMLAIALLEHGREREARELTRRTVTMIGREGFWEYYDSRTGRGRRIRDFNWPGLALDMLDRLPS